MWEPSCRLKTFRRQKSTILNFSFLMRTKEQTSSVWLPLSRDLIFHCGHYILSGQCPKQSGAEINTPGWKFRAFLVSNEIQAALAQFCWPNFVPWSRWSGYSWSSTEFWSTHPPYIGIEYCALIYISYRFSKEISKSVDPKSLNGWPARFNPNVQRYWQTSIIGTIASLAEGPEGKAKARKRSRFCESKGGAKRLGI